ncbi:MULTISPECIES: hypothetical protein [Streptomyces]|nr:hypothetical protein [Streptomyces virginiae]
MDTAAAADPHGHPYPRPHTHPRALRSRWLTRRLHIDLLRVCSAFGPRG